MCVRWLERTATKSLKEAMKDFLFKFDQKSSKTSISVLFCQNLSMTKMICLMESIQNGSKRISKCNYFSSRFLTAVCLLWQNFWIMIKRTRTSLQVTYFILIPFSCNSFCNLIEEELHELKLHRMQNVQGSKCNLTLSYEGKFYLHYEIISLTCTIP